MNMLQNFFVNKQLFGEHMTSYTIPFFINTISKVPVKNLKNISSVLGLANVIAPVGGINSVKINTLNTLLGFSLNDIIVGDGHFGSYGSTPRARLLKALKLRKTHGVSYIFGY